MNSWNSLRARMGQVTGALSKLFIPTIHAAHVREGDTITDPSGHKIPFAGVLVTKMFTSYDPINNRDIVWFIGKQYLGSSAWYQFYGNDAIIKLS